MIAAMGSGSGKTIVTAGLLMALKKRNIAVRSFKCGPDYIDPMFHTRVLGVPCRNLDLFLLGERGVLRELSGIEGSDIHQETSGGFDDFAFGVKGRNQESAVKEPDSSSGIGKGEQPLAVIEGAMGFYDGIGGTTKASAYDIAQLLGTPVILVVKPRGQSATLAAQICGLMNFRPENHIAGVILNECSAALFDHLRPIIERECGIPVFGYLPKMEEAKVESRHLGLLMADEIPEFRDKFEAIAARMEETVEIDRILACAGSMENETVETRRSERRSPEWLILHGKSPEIIAASPSPATKHFPSTMRHLSMRYAVREPSLYHSARCVTIVCPRISADSISEEAIPKTMQRSSLPIRRC